MPAVFAAPACCRPFVASALCRHPSIASPRTFHGPGRCCGGRRNPPAGWGIGGCCSGNGPPGGAFHAPELSCPLTRLISCRGSYPPSRCSFRRSAVRPPVPPFVLPSRRSSCRPAVRPAVRPAAVPPLSRRPAACCRAVAPARRAAAGREPRKNCSECARYFSKSALQSLIFRENPLFFPERVYLCGRKNGWRECAVCCEIRCGSGCSCCWAARISSSHEAMRSPSPPSVR